MSIYASLPGVGLDEFDGPNGEVLTYMQSHVFPHPDNPRAAVGLASIPAWCVPGSEVEYNDEAVAEYLRLDVLEDADGYITATVVLTVAGATALRDQLTTWLDEPKEKVS